MTFCKFLKTHLGLGAICEVSNSLDPVFEGADHSCHRLFPMSESGLPDQVFKLASINYQTAQVCTSASHRPDR
jgi:hypothetical protein